MLLFSCHSNEEIHFNKQDKVDNETVMEKHSDLRTKVLRFSPRNNSENLFGFFEYEDGYDGIIGSCILNKDTLLVVDSEHGNIKLVDISDNSMTFGKIIKVISFKEHGFFPGNKSVMFDEKIFIVGNGTGQFMIDDGKFENPDFKMFETGGSRAFCSFSKRNDSLFVLYDGVGLDVPDVYSYSDDIFFKSSSSFKSSLYNNSFGNFVMENSLDDINDSLIRSVLDENYLLSYSSFNKMKVFIVYDYEINKYVFLVASLG